MNKFLQIVVLIFTTFQTKAELLDKIVAVVNDNTITLSQIRRVKENLAARRNISPQIFNQSNYTQKELIEIEVQISLVRAKLTEMGYVISDDQVEAQVKSTEERLGLNREALLKFLNSNNFSFDEYFELIRSSIEYNLFLSRVIQPLISITEQDVKNAYYKKYSNQKSLSFKYELIDFSLEKNRFKKGMLKEFKSVLTEYQQNGILPQAFSELSTNVLNDIREGGLTQNLKKALNSAEEGGFTSPVLLGSNYHVFYIKKKDLVESEDFIQKRNQIKGQIFQDSIISMSKNWLESESQKNYIKYFL